MILISGLSNWKRTMLQVKFCTPKWASVAPVIRDRDPHRENTYTVAKKLKYTRINLLTELSSFSSIWILLIDSTIFLSECIDYFSHLPSHRDNATHQRIEDQALPAAPVKLVWVYGDKCMKWIFRIYFWSWLVGHKHPLKLNDFSLLWCL